MISASSLDPAVLDGLARELPSAPQDDMVAPFTEGAKARHIVDLCSALGLAAIFVDRAGGVFHATPATRDFLGDGLAIRAGHLVASSARANDRIQEEVSKALCAMGSQAVRRSLEIRDDRTGATQLVVVDYPNSSPAQLLKVVVVLTRDPKGSRSDVTTLIRHLNKG